MSAAILPYRRRQSAEEKVRKIERDIAWRVRLYRAKRAIADWWPFVVLPFAIAAMVVEACK